MRHSRRFNFRCDQAFLDAVDRWRAKQPRIPSQSEAIRVLAQRGAAFDNYFPTILKNSIFELISAGFFSESPEPEIYERFHAVVTASLDKAADLEKIPRQTRDSSKNAPGDAGHAAPETPAQDISAPKMQRYSR